MVIECVLPVVIGLRIKFQRLSAIIKIHTRYPHHKVEVLTVLNNFFAMVLNFLQDEKQIQKSCSVL